MSTSASQLYCDAEVNSPALVFELLACRRMALCVQGVLATKAILLMYPLGKLTNCCPQ